MLKSISFLEDMGGGQHLNPD